jgi:hypothetical protein
MAWGTEPEVDVEDPRFNFSGDTRQPGERPKFRFSGAAALRSKLEQQQQEEAEDVKDPRFNFGVATSRPKFKFTSKSKQ